MFLHSNVLIPILLDCSFSNVLIPILLDCSFSIAARRSRAAIEKESRGGEAAPCPHQPIQSSANPQTHAIDSARAARPRRRRAGAGARLALRAWPGGWRAARAARSVVR